MIFGALPISGICPRPSRIVSPRTIGSYGAPASISVPALVVPSRMTVTPLSIISSTVPSAMSPDSVYTVPDLSVLRSPGVMLPASPLGALAVWRRVIVPSVTVAVHCIPSPGRFSHRYSLPSASGVTAHAYLSPSTRTLCTPDAENA